MAFPDGWTHKLAITISSVQILADLTGWTLVFDQAFAGVLTQADGPLGASGMRPILADGGDIRFSYDDIGAQEMAVDIRTADINNDPGLAKLEVAAKIPLVSTSTDTVVYMWWGNASATKPLTTDTYGQYAAYDADHVFVSDDGGGRDRSSYARVSTGYGGVSKGGATGMLGAATDFDGVDDYMSFPDSDSLSFLINGRTIEFLSNLNTIKGESTAVGKCDADDKEYLASLGLDFYGVANYIGNVTYDNASGGHVAKYTQLANIATWDYYSFNYDGGDTSNALSTYRNAGLLPVTSVGSSSFFGPRNAASNLTIGGKFNLNDYHGLLDEIRISKINRSPAWIDANYKNQFNVAGFLQFSGITDIAPVGLSASSCVISAAAGAISVQLPLSAINASIAEASGALSADLKINAHALVQSIATAGLDINALISSSADSKSSVAGSIIINASLSGSAIAKSAAQANLSNADNNDLAATAAAQSSAAGSLKIDIPMSGAAKSYVSVSGGLSAIVHISSSSASVSNATGGLNIETTLSVHALAQSLASAGLKEPDSLSASAKSSARSQSIINISLPLSASALANSSTMAILSKGAGNIQKIANWTAVAKERNYQHCAKKRDYRICA